MTDYTEVTNYIEIAQSSRDHWFKDRALMKAAEEIEGLKKQLDQEARESEGGEAVGVVTFDGTVAWFPGARVHAGMEVYIAPQPDKWIPCSERLPTMNDADHYGQVIGWDSDNRESVIGPPCDFKNAPWLTHWLPTGLTETSPPQQESE